MRIQAYEAESFLISAQDAHKAAQEHVNLQAEVCCKAKLLLGQFNLTFCTSCQAADSPMNYLPSGGDLAPKAPFNKLPRIHNILALGVEMPCAVSTKTLCSDSLHSFASSSVKASAVIPGFTLAVGCPSRRREEEYRCC